MLVYTSTFIGKDNKILIKDNNKNMELPNNLFSFNDKAPTVIKNKTEIDSDNLNLFIKQSLSTNITKNDKKKQ